MPHRFQGIVDLAKILSQHGITKAVISPGSRNVPLINAFLQNQNFECISVVDERSAGYYALGLSLKIQKPVVLICTSGTATLNYAPAVAEAFYQKIPLIIVTADRPPELIGQRDNQTINQVGIYNNFIAKDFQFPTEIEKEVDLTFVQRIANEAVNLANQQKEPVHINIPLREPLYVELPIESDCNIIENSSYSASNFELPGQLEQIWKEATRKVILVGQSNINPELQDLLSNLSADPSVLILAENTSNVHITNCITAVERLFLFLKANPKEDFNPDLLVTLCGSVVSKQVKLYFREHKPKNHWHIGNELEIVDTFNSLTHTINTVPTAVIPTLLQLKSISESGFQNSFLNLNNKLEQVQSNYIESLEFSDLLVYKTIIKELPGNVSLHLGNSTAIRYSQLFETKENNGYFSNRGVSGIDGSSSTAAGFSQENKNLTLALVGDISFLYDSNALWIRSLSNNLRIIVINNGGGDIFKWINNSGKSDLNKFIETPQNVNIELLTKACGLKYLCADSTESLKKNLSIIFEPSEKAIVLEVKTSDKPNSDILKKLYKSFKDYKYE